MDQLDLPKISRSKPDKVKAKSSSVKLKKKIKEKKLKKQKKRKKKKKQRDSSESSTDSSSSSTTSSSSSDSSDEESNRKHKKRKKKKDKMKKKSKRSKNDGKKIETKSLDKTLQRSAVVGSPTEADVGPSISLSSSKIRAPMTKAEWEKQQSELRWVIDPETGRKRLIRGSGEVMEEIVSKERHRAINKEATAADGHYYQTQSLNMAKYST